MTLNWAVVAFLDLSSGGAVGGASVSSKVGTAGSFGSRGQSMDGRDYSDISFCDARGPQKD